MRVIFLALLLLARPVTQEETIEVESADPVFSIHNHDGEFKFGVYAGAGSTRQLLVFCLHPREDTPYQKWQATVIHVEDAPEP